MKFSHIIAVLFLTPFYANGQDMSNDISSFSYDYKETVHENTFTYPKGMDAGVLSFDFNIKVSEFDTINQYATFDFIIKDIYENSRIGFEFLDLLIDRTIRIEYQHEKDVKWIKPRSILDSDSEKFKTQVNNLSKLKRNLEYLMLREFGLFDGLFLTQTQSVNGINVFCNDSYNFQYEIERKREHAEELRLTINKIYDKSIIQKNFTSNLEEYMKEAIELNVERKGEVFDPTSLDGHASLKREQLDQIFENLDLAEDQITQYFESEYTLPIYSEATYYNIGNVCKRKRLSLEYNVRIEQLEK